MGAMAAACKAIVGTKKGEGSEEKDQEQNPAHHGLMIVPPFGTG